MPIVVHSSIFLVNEHEEVLLVREGKEKVYGLLNLPGGKMEHGEQVVEAAIREAQEETGLKVSPSHVIGVYTSANAENDYVHFVFLARTFSGDIHIADTKILEAIWLPIAQLQTMGEKEVLNAHKVQKICTDYAKGQLPTLDFITNTSIRPLPK